MRSSTPPTPHRALHPARAPCTPRPRARRALVVAAAVLAGAHAAAQPASVDGAVLEEIVVTAELLPTTWLEQTASSSVVTANTIAERAAAHLENLLLVAPNVNSAGGSSRARFFQVRGIGERSQFVEPLNPSVGLLVDNVDFSGMDPGAGLFDIEQVEILRGPQGTLHGANALAGLISLRSAAPTEDFEGRVYAGVGDYRRRELGAVLSGPLVAGQLSGRLAAFRHESDGFMDNAFLGRSDSNARDERMLRARLRWQPSDAQQLDLTAFRGDIDNGYDAFSLDNTRTTLSDQPGRDTQRSDALALHWQHSGSLIRTEVLASVADSEREYSYDEDWSFVGIAPALEYSSFDRYLRDRRSYSAQLRISGADPAAIGDASLRWVAGLYALDDDERLRREYTFLASPFGSRFSVTTSAAFGQADFDLGARWRLSAGLRVARRQMEYRDSNAIEASPNNDLWGGKLALGYDSEHWGHVYAALSRGYRAGGVNAGILAFPVESVPDSSALEGLQFFDEELLYNVELGHRLQSDDGRLSSALTLFYMDRRDQQVGGSLVIPRGDGSTAFVDFTDNAASGHNAGIEWELRARPHEHVEAYANVGLLRAEFDRYVNADGRDLAGRDQAHAPRYQFAVGATWHATEALSVGLQLEGRDAFFFSDRHDAQAPAFELLHLRLDYARAGWTLSLWGRNLLDEDYFVRGFGSFGNDPRKGYVTEEYRQFGDPRQVGASVELRF